MVKLIGAHIEYAVWRDPINEFLNWFVWAKTIQLTIWAESRSPDKGIMNYPDCSNTES